MMGRLRNSLGFGTRNQFRELFTNAQVRRIALVILSTICGTIGTWLTYTGLRDGAQREMSCGEYVAVRPDDHWLKLTNCEYDVDHYAVKSSSKGGSITSIYLPLRPVDDTSSKAVVLVLVDDRDVVDVFDDYEHGRTPSDAAVQKAWAVLAKPTEGIVTSGLDLDHGDRGKLEDLNLDLDEDFVLLKAGSTPHLIAGIVLLGVGLTAGALLLVTFLADRRRRLPPKPAPLPKATLRRD